LVITFLIMNKIYTYAKCGTCKKAVSWLTEQGIGFEEIPIRDQPPTEADLRLMLQYYDGELKRLFNTSGQDYRALDMKTRLPQMGVDEIINLLSQNGNLVKRPFLLTEKGGLVGFREEEWVSLFDA